MDLETLSLHNISSADVPAGGPVVSSIFCERYKIFCQCFGILINVFHFVATIQWAGWTGRDFDAILIAREIPITVLGES